MFITKVILVLVVLQIVRSYRTHKIGQAMKEKPAQPPKGQDIEADFKIID